jgi:predicted protein tyrosine phosphatase
VGKYIEEFHVNEKTSSTHWQPHFLFPPGMEGVKSQVHFTEEIECTEWEPNRYKGEKCMSCSRLFTHHYASNVTDEQVVAYLAALDAKNPSNLILASHGERGSLFLGSFQALGEDHLRSHQITHAVQCAKHLEIFFNGWGKKLNQLEADGVVEVLRLHWVDGQQELSGESGPFEALLKPIEWIHDNLQGGRNVVVNCAQGKSRSTTVVAAYLMTRQDWDLGQAMSYVKARRAIAEPNPWFMEQLDLFHASTERLTLTAKWQSTQVSLQ